MTHDGGAAGAGETWETLATDLFNLVLGNFEWVRAQGGRHSVCPLCHATCERDGGPGHMDDCPRMDYARRFDALRAALREPPPQEADRFFWVMERPLDGTPAYWDGGHAESFTRNIHKAVQWCRKDDLLNCLSFTRHYQQWGWTPVEHGIMAASARLREPQEPRDPWALDTNLGALLDIARGALADIANSLDMRPSWKWTKYRSALTLARRKAARIYEETEPARLREPEAPQERQQELSQLIAKRLGLKPYGHEAQLIYDELIKFPAALRAPQEGETKTKI